MYYHWMKYHRIYVSFKLISLVSLLYSHCVWYVLRYKSSASDNCIGCCDMVSLQKIWWTILMLKEYWVVKHSWRKERRAMVFGLRCQVVNDDILSKYYYAIALTKATTLSQKRLEEMTISIHTKIFFDTTQCVVFLVVDEFWSKNRNLCMTSKSSIR